MGFIVNQCTAKVSSRVHRTAGRWWQGTLACANRQYPKYHRDNRVNTRQPTMRPVSAPMSAPSHSDAVKHT